LDDNIFGGNNAWYVTAGSPINAVVPVWDASPITADPMISQTGSKLSIGAGSPIINQSTTTLTRGIYGALRGASSNVGAVDEEVGGLQ